MRLLIIILILAPAICYGQTSKAKSRASSPIQTVTQKKFRLDSFDYNSKRTLDTIYYSDKKIKAIGFYVADDKGKKTPYRIGLWTEYFNNGEIRSIGNYIFNKVYGCCSAMPCFDINCYKTGEWIYYYDNGQVKATGTYKVERIAVNRGVANQFLYTSLITDSWNFYDADGQTTKDKQAIISTLEKPAL